MSAPRPEWQFFLTITADSAQEAVDFTREALEPHIATIRVVSDPMPGEEGLHRLLLITTNETTFDLIMEYLSLAIPL